MKGIYFCFYNRRSCYLYMLQEVCFYFAKKKFCCCYSYNSVKVLETPGIALKVLETSWNVDARKVLERIKKSPGKSWNLNQFLWREPCIKK